MSVRWIRPRSRLFSRLGQLLLLTALVLAVSPASITAAAPLRAPAISISPTSGPPGTTVTVSGSGFSPGFEAEIRWDGAMLDSFPMPGSGSFARTIAVPGGAGPGGHTISVCNYCGGGEFEESASAGFTVVLPATATSIPVPPTATSPPVPTATARPTSGPPERPETFGYGSWRQRGTRSLLTILIEYSDAPFDPGHTPAFYEALFFGVETGTGPAAIAGRGGFFDENSFGQFYFTNAGVIGPYLHPDDPATAGDETTYECAWDRGGGCNGGHLLVLASAIRQADADGFDFARYDRNGDGQVTNQELVIYVIEAVPTTPGDGASARPTNPRCIPVAGGVEVCAYVPGSGEDVGAASAAHELSHVIGVAYEAYGAGVRNNNFFNVMAGTIFGRVDDRRIFHLDPFAKMKLGWLRPEIVTTSETRCVDLTAIQEAGPGPRGPSDQALLVYDPARGTREFFLVEYRRPLPSNYDGDPFGTLDGRLSVPDGPGVGIWYLQVNAGSDLGQVPAVDGAMGTDSPIYIIPPAGSPGRPAGGDGFWTPGDGEARPAWVVSGDPSAVVINVESIDGDIARVRVGEGACPPGGPPESGLPRCFTDRSLLETRCRDILPGLELERITPWPVPPDRPFVVRWVITPLDDLLGPLTLTDRLPGAGGSGEAGGDPWLESLTIDELPPVGQTLELHYDAPPAGEPGRYELETEVRYTGPDGLPVIESLGTEIVVLDEQAEILPEEMGPQGEGPLEAPPVEPAADAAGSARYTPFLLALAGAGLLTLAAAVLFSLALRRNR